jgi:hypothetical protein
MTQELKPEDLRVGDVVDVTFRRAVIVGGNKFPGDPCVTLHLRIGRISNWVHSDWVSNATITRSPDVIEARDMVRVKNGRGGPRRVLHVHEDQAWIEQIGQGDYPVQAVRDLILVSKGVGS